MFRGRQTGEISPFFCRRLVGFVLVGLATLGVAVITPSASADTVHNFPCITLTGDGSENDPWLLWSDDDLGCFVPGHTMVPSGFGADAYIGLAADLTWTSADPLFVPQGFTNLHFDGHGRSLTIKDVTNSHGVFNDTNDAEISNLTVRVVNSSLADGAGWISGKDTGSTFTRVSSNGTIPAGGGGIVGSADGSAIITSFSSGVIGVRGGGIVGANSKDVTVSGSFSTGLISDGAGGIVGGFSVNATVTNSSSSGFISTESGGLIGSNSTTATVVNSYSAGNVGTLGAALVGANGDSPTALNSTGFASDWSDVVANSILTSGWKTCAVNVPYFVGAFYPDDHCGTVRTARITYDGSSTTATSLSSPADDTLTLVNQGQSGPFSFVALVGGTATVTMAGTNCTGTDKCRVYDLVQPGAGARRDLVIVSGGTVLVHRYNAWTGWATETVEFTVTPTPTTTTTMVPTTTTIASTVGTTNPGPRILTLKKGKKLSKARLLKWYKVRAPRGSKVTLRISGSSRRYCKVVGTSVKAMKVGRCKVATRVVPKKGRKISKRLSITVIK